jgi:hypothetical protein
MTHPDPDPADPTLFVLDATPPILPYAGSSGWSGSETSRERAERADHTTLTGHRDISTLAMLHGVAEIGVTWGELADAQGLHHGEASAVLSRLHQVGRIVRLSERRGKSQVYVLPEYVDGRATSDYRPNVSRSAVVKLLDEVDERLRANDVGAARTLIAIAVQRYGS